MPSLKNPKVYDDLDPAEEGSEYNPNSDLAKMSDEQLRERGAIRPHRKKDKPLDEKPGGEVPSG